MRLPAQIYRQFDATPGRVVPAESYAGFAINGCLLMAPGGMVEMARHGCLCSTNIEAVTAVENGETARDEHETQQALWRVALEFGFVFSLADFLAALRTLSHPSVP